MAIRIFTLFLKCKSNHNNWNKQMFFIRRACKIQIFHVHLHHNSKK